MMASLLFNCLNRQKFMLKKSEEKISISKLPINHNMEIITYERVLCQQVFCYLISSYKCTDNRYNLNMGKTCSHICSFNLPPNSPENSVPDSRESDNLSEQSIENRIKRLDSGFSHYSKRLSVYQGKQRKRSSYDFQLPKIINRQSNRLQKYRVYKNKTEEISNFLKKCIDSHFICRVLSQDSRKLLTQNFQQYVLKSGIVICEQGEPGFHFYVIESGEVEVFICGQLQKKLNAGDYFGQTALIGQSERTATVKTASDCIIWSITQNNYKKVKEKISDVQYEENRVLWSKIPFLQHLTTNQKERIISMATLEEFSEGDTIIREGDTGNNLYIMKQGKAVCEVHNVKIRDIVASDYFGEIAILRSSRRTATITAKTNVKLLALTKTQLQMSLGNSLDSIISSNCQRMAIEKSKRLNFFTKIQVDLILDASTIVKYSKGEVVIESNQRKGEFLYIVINGSLKYGSQTIKRLDCFGEKYLLKGSSQFYSVPCIAAEETIVSKCHRSSIEGTLNTLIQNIKQMNRLIRILKKISIFSNLPREKLEQISKVITKRHYKRGVMIIEERTPADSFMIIKKGTVDIIKNGIKIRSIASGSYFGERSILSNELRTASAVAKGPVDCWYLDKNDFLHIIEGPLRNYILKRMPLQDDTVSLHNLVPIHMLGQGAYGTVILSYHPQKDFYYAVKCMDNHLIKKYQLSENIEAEQQILMQLDHTMIMKLVKPIQNTKNICYIMEFIHGKDFYDTVKSVHSFSNSDYQFYVSSLIIVLQYLHTRMIVYRDLKPENIMVDEDGYLKLVDFGTAKVINGRTYTTIGTPHYMAPEVINGRGYSFNADLWSLGVVMYELVYRELPFGAMCRNAVQVYKSVVNDTAKFPANKSHDPEIISFIKQLLNRNEYMRCKESIDELKTHPWLKNYRCDDIMLRKIQAPMKIVQNPMDIGPRMAKMVHESVIDYANRFSKETKNWK